MGEPEYLSRSQVERLEHASRLRPEKIAARRRKHAIEFQLNVPPSSDAAITL
jgi:hypothetical protein